MNTINKMSSMTEQSLEKLERIRSAMKEKGDAVHEEQMEELIEKLELGELFIAICGHFSAGKSSLINKLSGKDYLPSGPIPASANVVTIRGGELQSSVTHHPAGGENKRHVRVPVDQLHDYCLNGDDIASVELKVPSPLLLENKLALLDTPGIDSTDERHHAATSAALHLADVVFYVVDYNHVESENNLSFSKKMKELGKPLYLIINQIDKHREKELSITEFRRRVAESFQNWDADPAGIFTLSIKYPDHPYNEWDRFIWLLQELGKRRDVLARTGTMQAMKECIAEHADDIFEQEQKEERERLLLQTDGMEKADAEFEMTRLKQQIEELENRPKQLENKVKQDIQQLVEHANIMPAVTRDKAEAYLESQQPAFKVGLFSSKKKTELEKERREQLFLKELQENIDTQIDWHLQQLLQETFQGAAFDSFQVQLDAADLKKQIQPGAVLSGQYTILYCRDLAAAIQARFRREAFSRVEQMTAEALQQIKSEIEAIKQKQEELAPLLKVYRELDELDQQKAHYRDGLLQLLPEIDFAAAELPNLQDGPAVYTEIADSDQKHVDAAIDKQREKKELNAHAAIQMNIAAKKQKLIDAAHRLAEAADQIRDLESLREMADYLQAKAARMKKNRFTIALFGAFSAGKSSFINAMLADDVVPVSPHPTTAAVNRIVPITDEFPHGTAKVQMKTREQLEEEITYALELLGEKFHDLDQAMALAQKLKPAFVEGTAKVQVTFLKAAAAGWQEMKPLLGQTIKTDLHDFRKYAADERWSGFVQSIDLHYQSPLTDQGIVLVDTPGADSINARHTGVAFNYIKNADAIIYVTYYNHAFARADQEFLLQLGRVKESFEMDKMFFLVNAADLASSDDELSVVVEHVTNNLAACDIRNPKIYPVSSLTALDAKLNENEPMLEESGFPRFENDFYSFVFDELADVLVHSADNDIAQCVKALEEWSAAFTGEELERERKKEQLLHHRAILANEIPELHDDFSGKIEGETKEWMYYVKQRILYRFGDTFNAAFHPSTLSANDGEIRSRLRLAWKELVSILSIQCSQEVLAITLKVENMLQQRLKDRRAEQLERIRQKVPTYPGIELETPQFETASVSEQLNVIDKDEKWLAKQFKNAKTFFESGGKQRLRELIEPELMSNVSDYVDEHTDQFIQRYKEQYVKLLRTSDKRLTESVQSHIDAVVTSLTDQQVVENIKQKQTRIERLIKSN